MRLLRSIFAGLLFAGLSGAALGQGVTYPDGTASPFKPGFFGVGIPSQSTRSYVFGVAAQGGSYLGAVGQINDDLADQAPELFTPGGGYRSLPIASGGKNGGTVSGISGDGKIKVGDAGGAAYWDANNDLHVLPGGIGSNVAAAITPDGLAIAGSVITEVRSDGITVFEAALWVTGITGASTLGVPESFTSSLATAISENGAAVCGFLNSYDNRTTPPTEQHRAFLYRDLQMRVLSGLAVNADTAAYGVSETTLSGGSIETVVVGISGPVGRSTAVLWHNKENPEFPVGQLEGIANRSAAYAVQASCRAPSSFPGRIVGYRGDSGSDDVAFMWNIYGYTEGSIASLLVNTYRVAKAAKWSLFGAYALSADGYTVAGNGRNPEGKLEGWVAVLPPVFFPPIVIKPPNRVVLPSLPFVYQVTTKNPTRDTVFSAENLPPGFKISQSGEITGSWFSDETAKVAVYSVKIFATNSEGTGTATFTMSLLPPPAAGSGGKSKSIQGHTFLQQNKPPGEQTFLASFSTGVSSNGQVAVGHDGVASESRAYRWTAADGASGLPMLDGALRTYGTALATSADGNTIVGQASAAPADDGSERSVAAVWRPAAVATAKAIKIKQRHYAEREASAAMEAINVGLFPGGIISIANGVSADGSVVVGYGDQFILNFGSQVYQAFRWTQSSGMVGLGWIDTADKFSQAYGVSADGSIIVGVDGQQAFRWTQAQGMVGLGKAPGATSARATAISADNSTIIGFNRFGSSNDNNRAFRWTAAEGMSDLGVLSGDQFSEAKAVSADGSVIVGQSGIQFVSGRAFIWNKTNGVRDLKAVLVAGNPNLANWKLTSADGISADSKTVTGWGTNPNGDLEGYTAVLEVRPAQLLNISTRMRVLIGDKVLIGGFIITGTEAKTVMIRGIGPSLGNFGLQGVMADPTLELHQGNTIIARNDNWKTRPDGSSQQLEIEATTIPPSNELESAIVMTLNPGTYTAILADKNNDPGLGIVEVYDLTRQSNSKLANISTRGFVDTGDNVMIGGFIAGGGTAGATAGEVVRAIGPSLTGVGVPGALEDTTLELYNSSGTLLASNDDWKTRADGSSQEAEIKATTIPPGDERESALAITLAPGNYTAIVRGKTNTTGVSLIEVYHLQ
jgi:probable HAF family extracellular repeat protein